MTNPVGAAPWPVGVVMAVAVEAGNFTVSVHCTRECHKLQQLWACSCTCGEVGRDSSSRTNKLFNVPFLVLKARHLSSSAFCNFYRLGVPEQALGLGALGLL